MTAIWAILVNIASIPLTALQVVYTILAFIIGVVCNTFFVGMVLVMELVGPKYRTAAANIFNYFYVVGEFLTLVFGYIFKDYRAFHICITVYFAIFALIFWLVPESPRFLLITGRTEEAKKILKRIARANNKTFNDDFINLKGVDPSQVKKSVIILSLLLVFFSHLC